MNDSNDSCAICFEQFDEDGHEPRKLPCCHTFCTECLDKMDSSGYVTCPLDRTVTELGDLGIYEFPVDSTKLPKIERGVTSPLGSVIYSSDFIDPSRPSTTCSHVTSIERNVNTSCAFVDPFRTSTPSSTNGVTVSSYIQDSAGQQPITNMRPATPLMATGYTNPQYTYQPNVINPIQRYTYPYYNGQVAVGVPVASSGFQTGFHSSYLPVQPNITYSPDYYNNHINTGFSSPYQWSYHYNQPPVRQLQQPVQTFVPHSLQGHGQNMTINTPTGRMEMHQSSLGQSMSITHY